MLHKLHHIWLLPILVLFLLLHSIEATRTDNIANIQLQPNLFSTIGGTVVAHESTPPHQSHRIPGRIRRRMHP
ncbi:hypothetical protein J3R30DRAFT_2698954 [Lentinula aciculospora]|uniref:Transmembrane protein n=1 Tax=Lentinula aciculospora TaxID=153920 RepID=A0A9W9ACP3_9AGAR|nr:hypothetical protein J3R30DRAFT_2698954 [Lentinula aciculospora]